MTNVSTHPSGAGIPLTLGIICLLILGISACDRKSDKPPQGSQAPAKEVGPKPFKNEVYRAIDDREVVTITSPTELELLRKGSGNLICEYTRQDDGLRVVVTVFGTKTAEYFSTVKGGLRHDNLLLLDVQHYQDYKAAQAARAAQQAAQQATADRAAIAQIGQQLRLNDHDRQLVTGIKDGRDWKTEPAFYMLLGRLITLPTIRAEQLHQMEKPTYSSLLRDPDFYHGRPNSPDPGPMVPVQLKVQVFQVMKCTAENGRLDINKSYWDDKRPVWMIMGLKADGENPTAEPVFVYSVVEPPNLGPADQILPKGEKANPDSAYYSNGPTIEVAGIMYKRMQAMDRGAKGLRGAPDRDPEMRVYPIVLAWQIFGGVQKEAGIDEEMGH